MLAGCSSSSTLLSPRHRLRTEAAAAASAQQLQPCHFQLPSSMSTQRLDLPCSFSRKDSSSSSRAQQPIRPVGLSVEKKTSSVDSACSLNQGIRLPPLSTSRTAASTIEAEVKDQFWEKRTKGLKRFAEFEEDAEKEVKRKKRSNSENDLSLGELGGGGFWFHQNPSFHVPRSAGIDQPQFPYTFPNNPWLQSVVTELTDFKEPESSRALVGEPSGDSSTSSGRESLELRANESGLPRSAGIDQPQFPYTFPNNPWLQSVVTELTDFKEPESSRALVGEPSGDSSTSSGRESLELRANESGLEPEGGVGSRHGYNPYGDAGVEAEVDDEEESEVEQQGFELLSLLNGCVEAIGMKNIAAINHFISKLGELASPKGSVISRLTAYYTEGLALRVSRLWPRVFQISPPREFDRGDDESGTALRLLNQVSPIPKFLHFTSNEILLRHFEGKDRVHIIDFDIKLGMQWPSLFQSLASRTNPPSHVRITGVGESKQELNETGDRLAGFAGALNLPFEFHPVVDRLEDVRLWMLHVKEHESVAVNCAFQLHKTLYDASLGALRDFLGLIRSTNPTVVLMAEQEAEHNEPRLEARVSNSLRYYSAIFDLIGSSLVLDSPARIKVEDMVAREIRNIVACEGSDRVERHEGFGKWRTLMQQGGFRSNMITDREFLQSQILLKMYECDSYNVTKQGPEQEGGAAALTLSWMDQPLYTVSAWTPVDAAAGGSSSSFPQSS